VDLSWPPLRPRDGKGSPGAAGHKLNGKKVTEQGVWTFAMQKTAPGWRLAGWAWAQH